MSFDWKAFDALLAQRAPGMLSGLRSPADREQIEFTESVIGRAFPDELASSYLAHDGQDDNWQAYYAFFGRFRWYSLAGVASAYQRKMRALERALADGEPGLYRQSVADVRPDQAVRTDLWNDAWIPFGWGNAGAMVFIDMTPGPAGHAGQVIAWDQVDRARPRSIAIGLHALVDSLARALRDDEILCAPNSEMPGWTNALTGKALHRLPCET